MVAAPPPLPGSVAPTTADELAEAQRRIARLNRRLERERRAREEAEGIADRRMRELWLSNQELDERVAEQTKSITAAYDLLERSFDAATRFVSNLSHEMLTPLNGVLGMLELIEQNSHTDILASYVGTARDSTDRLHLLVRRLLDLVQLAAGLVQANPVNFGVADITGTVEQRWRVKFLQAQKLLTVSHAIDPDRVFHGDLERTLQIIDEILDNARLHASAGVVDLTLSTSINNDGVTALCAVVTDAGPGFVPGKTSGLFDAILRVDTSPGRATEGAGIGIGLAEELAKTLGGAVEITSAPGSPSVVSVTLPV